MIPEAADVPAHILNLDLARQMNEAASAGLSTGASARIKMNGKQFVLVNGNGDETPMKAADLTMAADGNAYLPAVIINAKPTLSKTYYAAAYNPSEEGSAPDCFSDDAVTPSSDVHNPQCSSCAACPHNAFGSDRDQNGNATAGKACTDTKILAVFCKGSVYKLKVTPSSLKFLGLYIKELSARGIPLGNVKTLLGFVEDSSFPVLTFNFGGFIDEAAAGKLAQLAESPEALDIVNEKMSAGTKQLKAPAKAAEPAKEEGKPAADDLGLDAPATTEPPVKVVKEEPVVEKVEAAPDDSDLAASLGL